MRPTFGHRRTHHHVPDGMDYAERQPPFPPLPPMPPGGPWPGGPFGDFAGGRRGRSRGHRHGPGRRSRRGDVRAAILALLVERPMHGYEMIQEITERSGQFWRPSPGSVYPTLQLLADEGLISSTEGSGGKRRFELTDEGRTVAEQLGTPPWEQIAQDANPSDVTLREAIGQLMGATFQVAQAATDQQKNRAVQVLNEARRELYAILGEAEPPPTDEDDED
jgi:DNA-binding PadR family transcriptional regulator